MDNFVWDQEEEKQKRNVNKHINKDWTLEEDEITVEFLREHGPMWAKLIPKLNNRRQSDVRNRWHSTCRWFQRNFKIEPETFFEFGRLRSDMPDEFFVGLLQKSFKPFQKHFRLKKINDQDQLLSWLVSLSTDADFLSASSDEQAAARLFDKHIQQAPKFDAVTPSKQPPIKQTQSKKQERLVDTPAKQGASVLLAMMRGFKQLPVARPVQTKQPSPIVKTADPVQVPVPTNRSVPFKARFKDISNQQNVAPPSHEQYVQLNKEAESLRKLLEYQQLQRSQQYRFYSNMGHYHSAVYNSGAMRFH